MKNKILFYLVSIFVLLNLADIFTTLFILPGESNPLYHLFGNITIVIFIKLLVVGVVVMWAYANVFNTEYVYYAFIAMLVYANVVLLFAQYSNIYGILHPAQIAEAAAMPVKEKVAYYFRFIGLIYMAPLLFSLLVFWLYQKSVGHAIINKNLAKQPIKLIKTKMKRKR